VNNLTRKKPGHSEADRDAERRRIGRVVHDDRGNASVTWRDAPADLERPVLEVLGDPGLSIKSDETFDPYAHRTLRDAGVSHDAPSGGHAGRPHGGSGGNRGNGTRTDLRRLSDWIKMMRELEQRKRENGGGGESGG
jgi:hypothetical protein